MHHVSAELRNLLVTLPWNAELGGSIKAIENWVKAAKQVGKAAACSSCTALQHSPVPAMRLGRCQWERLRTTGPTGHQAPQAHCSLKGVQINHCVTVLPLSVT
jgi:hypothetical protein